MAADDVDHDSADAHPRRGLRKRWIFLIAICGSLMWAWMSLFQERSVAVVTLPDGRTVRIHKTTVGREHSYHKASTGLTSAEIWANKWLARIDRQITPSFARGVQVVSDSPTICFWHSFDWTANKSETTPEWLVLSDQQGWRTAGNLSYLHTQPKPVPTSPGAPIEPQVFSMDMPSSCNELKVELLNAKGRKLGSTVIPYAVPQVLLQTRNPRPFPVVQTVKEMAVTLVGLKADWSHDDEANLWFGDTLSVTPEVEVKIDGQESNEWIPLVGGLPFCEPISELMPAVASVESLTGTIAPLNHCTVSPFESAWKLHLPLICRNAAHATSAHHEVLSSISIDGGIAPLSDASEIPIPGNPQVRLIGAGRDGSFVYECTGEAKFQINPEVPLQLLTRNQLQGTFQSTIAPRPGNVAVAWTSLSPMTVSLNLTASRPHLVISVTDMGPRSPYVVVKDQKGQELEGELYNAQGLLIWLAKLPYAEVETVDAEVLLQTPRFFSFDVVPPTVPPRPQN